MKNVKNDTRIRFEFAKALAWDVGRMIRSELNAPKRTTEKSGFYDIVTDVDLKVEREVKRRISALFKEDDVLGEETGKDVKTGGKYLWIVDPIDGTTNFSKGIPHSCVSIGLLEDQLVVAGVVYDPFLDELFEAAKGEGAFLNGKPISVSTVKELEKAVLNTGYQYSAVHMRQKVLKDYEAFFGKVRALRIYGSAVLDFCYVACGRIDGFWEYELKPWDMAAGSIIVREAGGVVLDLFKEEFTVNSQGVLATTPSLVGKITEILSGEKV